MATTCRVCNVFGCTRVYKINLYMRAAMYIAISQATSVKSGR